MNPRDFNYNKTDFRSKYKIIEHLLESEIVSKMLVLERFREGDSSVVSQDIVDAADLLWIAYENTPRASKAQKRRKSRNRRSKVADLSSERKARMACAC